MRNKMQNEFCKQERNRIYLTTANGTRDRKEEFDCCRSCRPVLSGAETHLRLTARTHTHNSFRTITRAWYSVQTPNGSFITSVSPARVRVLLQTERFFKWKLSRLSFLCTFFIKHALAVNWILGLFCQTLSSVYIVGIDCCRFCIVELHKVWIHPLSHQTFVFVGLRH